MTSIDVDPADMRVNTRYYSFILKHPHTVPWEWCLDLVQLECALEVTANTDFA